MVAVVCITDTTYSVPIIVSVHNAVVRVKSLLIVLNVISRLRYVPLATFARTMESLSHVSDLDC